MKKRRNPGRGADHLLAGAIERIRNRGRYEVEWQREARHREQTPFQKTRKELARFEAVGSMEVRVYRFVTYREQVLEDSYHDLKMWARQVEQEIEWLNLEVAARRQKEADGGDERKD